MKKIDTYIIEKLKINKDSKLEDDSINRYLGKSFFIITEHGPNAHEHNYIECVKINKIKLVKQSNPFFESYKFEFNFLTHLSNASNEIKEYGLIQDMDLKTSPVIHSGKYLIHLLSLSEMIDNFDKYKKNKFFYYKDLTPNANLKPDEEFHFNMSDEDFEKLEKVIYEKDK